MKEKGDGSRERGEEGRKEGRSGRGEGRNEPGEPQEKDRREKESRSLAINWNGQTRMTRDRCPGEWQGKMG